jgi:hypothetical protein
MILLQMPMEYDSESEQLYIKGYKLDDEKICQRVLREADDIGPNWQFNWYHAILECIPRSAYIEIGLGREPSGEHVTVIVLDRGYDKKKLEQEPVHTEDKMFQKMAENILTPGVWPSAW